MEKKIADITKELRELYPDLAQEKEERVVEVFQNLKEIQKQSLPTAAYKKSLKLKLQTLSELSSENSSISDMQKSRFSLSLLSGLFASLIFVAGFFYVMQETLFRNPISGETLKLQNLSGELDRASENPSLDATSSENQDTLPENANILRAEDVIFDGIQNPTPKTRAQEMVNSDETQENQLSQGIISEEDSDTMKDSSSLEDTQEDASDNVEFTEDAGARTMMMKSPQAETTESISSSQDEIFQEPETGVLFMQLMSDTPSSFQVDTFQEYCLNQGGAFNASNRICTKGGNTCNESQFQVNACILENTRPTSETQPEESQESSPR